MATRFLTAILLILLAGGTAFAELRIYLFPGIEVETKEPLLGDIGKIEGDTPALKKIREMKIAPELYADGYIDRRELRSLLRACTDDIIIIHGNAVRVTKKASVEEAVDQAEVPEEKVLSVKTGERVHLSVRKNGILVEMNGTAVGEGRVGDEINVRLKGSRTVKGILRKGKMVEVSL